MSAAPVRLVSVSGGKDSTATLLLAIEQYPLEVSAVFCDTGNEHEATLEYVDYLGRVTGISITTLRQDFTDWWWRRRDYVANKWPDKGVGADVISRVLTALDRGPTGNPYLDLCMIKGRFPSRRMQFCTQFLKTEPMTAHALELCDAFGAVESWQGVRAEESASRAKLPEREDLGGGMTIYRPILHWTVSQVFDQHRKHGVKPNPLYSLGMNRVGCMPCINCRKGELMEISRRFPEHIDRIEEWEVIVAEVSKSGQPTFFPAPGDTATATDRGAVRQVVKWAGTLHGGKERNPEADTEAPACSSSYGLCE